MEINESKLAFYNFEINNLNFKLRFKMVIAFSQKCDKEIHHVAIQLVTAPNSMLPLLSYSAALTKLMSVGELNLPLTETQLVARPPSLEMTSICSICTGRERYPFLFQVSIDKSPKLPVSNSSEIFTTNVKEMLFL